MATLKLPNASSVVDYLGAQGKDSSYSARKRLYTDMGIDKRLGDYVGSESQNLNFLKALQTANSPKPPTTTAPGGVDFSAFRNTTPASSISGPLAKTGPLSASSAMSLIPGVPGASSIAPPAPGPQSRPTATSILGAAGIGAQSRATEPQQYKTTSGSTVVVTPTGEAQGVGTPDDTTSAQYDAQVKTDLGFSASDIVSDFNPSEADLINDYLSSQGGQLLMERVRLGEMDAEAAKEEARATLEAKYAGDFQKTEQNLAANGLAFSGIRTTQLKALADNLAASELEVDREFASKLLDADLDLREGILKGVEELIKDAQSKDKEAIQQLNAVGLAVINGQLVPTLSSQAAMRAERQLELSEQRLLLSERASARAEALFNKSIASLSASERRAAATVDLYRDQIESALRDGNTPAFALKVANDQARVTGVVLDAEQQAAVLAESKRLLESGEVEPLPPTSIETPEGGMFARLFGRE